MPQPIETLIQKLLRDLVSEYIAYPQHLEIKTVLTSRLLIIQWWAHAADCGKIIGKRETSNFKPLQNLLKLIGTAQGYEVELEWLCDPKTGTKEPPQPVTPSANWPRARIMALLQRIGIAASVAGVAEVEDIDAGTKIVANLKLATSETPEHAAAIQTSLRHLFKVIGAVHRQVLYVEVSREIEHEQQPATAAGRFAK